MRVLIDKDIVDLEKVDGVFGQFVANNAYEGDPVYDAVGRHFPAPLPEVMIPQRSTAALSAKAEDEQKYHDCHIIELGAKERIAWQKARNGDKSNLSINFTTTPN